jgi:transcriptional regulator with XRE-family HTH domain
LAQNRLASLVSEIRQSTESLPEDFHITKQQLQAALLWAKMRRAKKDLTVAELATALGLHGESGRVTVSTALSNFPVKADRIRLISNELYKARYRYQRFEARGGRKELLRHRDERTLRWVNEGRWPFKAPTGYVLDHGILKADSKWGPLVKEMFERVARGESPRIVAKELGIVSPYQMLRKHDYRPFKHGAVKGCIPYRGKLYRGQHEPLIDFETWNRAQFMVTARGEKHRKHPFGLLWIDDKRLMVDPLRDDKLREICWLYSEGRMGAQKIARTLNCAFPTVKKVLLDDHYKILGKDWEAANHRALVRFRSVKRD